MAQTLGKIHRPLGRCVRPLCISPLGAQKRHHPPPTPPQDAACTGSQWALAPPQGGSAPSDFDFGWEKKLNWSYLRTNAFP